MQSSIFGVGPGVELPSFIGKTRMRDENVAWNVDAGFFCALCALQKRVNYRSIPHYYFSIDGKPFHFVGEMEQKYTEMIFDGDINDERFVIYYVWGEEIVGFLTVGYQNLHIYLHEAMKLLIMPPALHLRHK